MEDNYIKDELKTTDIRQVLFYLRNGDEKVLDLPYPVEVYCIDSDTAILAQLIIDLMNKVKALEDKIKDLE